MHNRTPLLVTGASGQLGQLVLQHLSRLGATVIATTRTPQRIPPGLASPRHADFDQADSLPAAFAGARRMLLISTMAHAGPQRVAQHQRAIAAAVDAGVHSIVYTSLLNPLHSPLGVVADDHARTEALLRDCGLPHLVLRNAFYMDPIRQILAAAAQSGELVSACARGRVAYITRSDCALAAAHALMRQLEPGTAQHLDIAGPEALSYADIAAIGAEALGRPIAVRTVDQASRAEGLIAQGMPPPMARIVAHVEQALDSGVMECAGGDFAALTGRQACSLRDFLIG